MGADSGIISLEGNTVRYRSRHYGSWDLALDRVRVMGESTNDLGPFLDDYFLCFATGPGMWQEASFYADGLEQFLDALSERLGIALRLELAPSTDFASRVLWPSELLGQPMFKFADATPYKWFAKLFGATRVTQTYTDAVKSLLVLAG